MSSEEDVDDDDDSTSSDSEDLNIEGLDKKPYATGNSCIDPHRRILSSRLQNGDPMLCSPGNPLAQDAALDSLLLRDLALASCKCDLVASLGMSVESLEKILKVFRPTDGDDESDDDDDESDNPDDESDLDMLAHELRFAHAVEAEDDLARSRANGWRSASQFFDHFTGTGIYGAAYDAYCRTAPPRMETVADLQNQAEQQQIGPFEAIGVWDPLKLSEQVFWGQDTATLIEEEEKTKVKRFHRKIENGRLAMIGLFSLLSESVVPGSVGGRFGIDIPIKAYDGNLMQPLTEFSILNPAVVAVKPI